MGQAIALQHAQAGPQGLLGRLMHLAQRLHAQQVQRMAVCILWGVLGHSGGNKHCRLMLANSKLQLQALTHVKAGTKHKEQSGHSATAFAA